jgi:glutamine amidotransferase
MNNICILDYEVGNISSLKNFFIKIGLNFKYSKKEKDILDASHLVLPGVGSFNVAINKLSKHISIDFLNDQVLKKKKPILGICVGMQIMSTVGHENTTTKGLNWIEGSVRLIDSKKLPLPHVGWNNLLFRKNDSIFSEVKSKDFYFLNSYYFDAKNKSNIIAYSTYGMKFPSIIQKNNIFGFQFHPEKSSYAGIEIVKDFIKYK